MTAHLISIHTMDPRGSKVGGIETHVRQLVRHRPPELDIILVGVDEIGDLPLGRPSRIEVDGRALEFWPLIRVDRSEQTGAATSVVRSVTLRFALALARALPRLRTRLRGLPASVEVERFELAPVARLLGRPLVVVNHNEYGRGDAMDSLLARHFWVHETAERLACRLADKVVCVTPRLLERFRARFPHYADKGELLTVSVDTERFRPAPFATGDGVFRLVYAGRLDAFKDPGLMLAVAAGLAERFPGGFAFHYAGPSDPERFAEFEAARAVTVCHGPLPAGEVAALMRRCHAGILVSHFEGMPCFLLELLASGRPFVGLRLPQFDRVVTPGLNGRMVERRPEREHTATAVVAAAATVWAEIRAGALRPEAIAASIEPFSVSRQLARLFATHRTLALGEGAEGRVAPAEARR